jgi:serine/threonine protein kinase
MEVIDPRLPNMLSRSRGSGQYPDIKDFDVTDVEKQIGNVLISKSELGRGSYSVVKTGYDIKSHRKVAIKIIDKGTLTNIGRLNLEAELQIHQLISSFHHPNIVELYEVVEDTHRIYMIMELANGGDLVTLIEQKGKLTEDEAKPLFKQIVSAVQFLHSHNITHRDIKAENFLISKDSNGIVLKLSDFGLSAFMDQDKYFSTPCGSPCYAAPEVVNKQPYRGREVDVWSMGILLYTILCGRFPFSHPNMLSLFTMIKQNQYSVPAPLSEDAQDLIQRMLDKDFDKRIKIEGILEHNWLRRPIIQVDNSKPISLPRAWISSSC